MQKKKIININAKDFDNPEMEEQYNKWYSEHIAVNFKFEGMRKVERYKRIGDDSDAPRYLAVYYFDSMEDFKAYEKSPEHAESTQVPGKPDSGIVKPRFRVQYELIESLER
jgi:heme-degrading monooxygenase HmoA